MASATSVTLPPIPNGTFIGDTAVDLADVIFSILAELVPRSKHPGRPRGWYAEPAVQADMSASLKQRGGTRRSPHTNHSNGILREVVKIDGENLEKVNKTAVLS